VVIGNISSQASVAITVVSNAQHAANLQAQVTALQSAGVRNKGEVNALIAKLNLKGNAGSLQRSGSHLAFRFRLKWPLYRLPPNSPLNQPAGPSRSSPVHWYSAPSITARPRSRSGGPLNSTL
jgi:hypothetical protein